MKGLLIKDLKFSVASKQAFIICLAVGIFQLFSGSVGRPTLFGVTYFTFMVGMLFVMTISYDEYEDGFLFLLTLPISRKIYVIEKYILLGLGILSGWLFPIIIAIIVGLATGNGVLRPEELLTYAAVILPVGITLLVMLPVQLKFGAVHGRMVLFGFTALVVLVPILGWKILERLQVDVTALKNNVAEIFIRLGTGGLVLGAVLIALIATLISVSCSLRIMEKKEF